ncbi:MAG: hypothetical protein KDD38_06385 [Bdellovibrionales bacterium]|nr:hypothetical protein [Bdellovibrionales bacterium]
MGFRSIVLALYILSSTTMAAASPTNIYIYNDKGDCDGCSGAVAELLDQRRAQYAYAQKPDITARGLVGIKLWIQPGGDGIEMALHLKDKHKEALRNFVAAGGNYLGLCAGAFFADHFVDDANTIPGLGLLPGVSRDFSPINKDEMILDIIWNNIRRFMYFQDGATFDLHPSARVHTIARYSTGEPAVIEFRYGAGHVILSGVHPEANNEWRKNLNDPDGDDTYLAQELLDKLL